MAISQSEDNSGNSANVSEDVSEVCLKVGEKIGEYEVLKKLGSGHFSTVYAVRHLTQQKYCAAKVINRRFAELQSEKGYDYRKEVSIHAALEHENIVRFHEMVTARDTVMVCMDFVGGTLRDTVMEASWLDEEEARPYFGQLVGAVQHCHSVGVFHRDIKPENILVTAWEQVRLCDFGLACAVDVVGGKARGRSGTRQYSAPEVLWGDGGEYDGAKADAYSVGAVLYVMTHGGVPFRRERGENGEVKPDGVLNIHEDISEDLRDLLERLMAPQPDRRMDLNEIWCHPWMFHDE